MARGARDRYERSTKDERAADERRAWMREELQRWCVLRAIFEACYDAHADTPGTWSNTLLTAWLAEPQGHDAYNYVTHRARYLPTYPALRRQAWRALSGEYKRALLDEIAAEQAIVDDA